MLGISRARQLVDEKVTRPVSSALVLSIVAVIMAGLALMIGLSR